MVVKHIKSHLNRALYFQKIECLQVKTLMICFERTKGHAIPHLVYDKRDFENELRSRKHEVEVMELSLPMAEEDYNELAFTVYDTSAGEIFLFPTWAVLGREDCRIEVYCKENMSIAAAAAHWDIVFGPDCGDILEEYHIQRDRVGNLTVELEKLMFRCWDMAVRAPGEAYASEERLEWIERCQKSLTTGSYEILGETFKWLRETVEEYLENMQEGLEHHADLRLEEFYAQDVADGQAFLEEIKSKEQEVSHQWPLA